MLLDKRPLPRRGQLEVDKLLENSNLRQPPNSKGEYTVESILASKSVKSKKMYLVKWSGYPIEEATWEPAANLKNAKRILEAFSKEQV